MSSRLNTQIISYVAPLLGGIVLKQFSVTPSIILFVVLLAPFVTKLMFRINDLVFGASLANAAAIGIQFLDLSNSTRITAGVFLLLLALGMFLVDFFKVRTK